MSIKAYENAVVYPVPQGREPRYFKQVLPKRMQSIVTKEVHRQRRSRGKYGRVVYLDEVPLELADEHETSQPHEFVLREEEFRVIMEIISSFPPRQREAVLLHYYYGMGVADTAETMGLARPNVSQYLALAREKMRGELMRRTRQTANARLGALALLPAGSLMKQAMEYMSG